MDNKRGKLSIVIDVLVILVASEYFLKYVSVSKIEREITTGIDYLLILVLFVDFINRIRMEEDKISFIRKNWFDIMSLIPFIPIFRLFRVYRLVNKSSIKGFLLKIHYGLVKNSLYYVVFVVCLLAFVGGGVFYKLEGSQAIPTYWDGVWFAFVTMTTVGYGEYIPHTGIGRIFAVILMIVGIGFLGLLTGSIASVFMNNSPKLSKQHSKKRKIDLNDLTPNEFKEVEMFVDYVRSKRK